jgi:acyl-CoA hydrolase
VCTAQFSYVTVRDPAGGKVLCPPLKPETDAARWEMLLADARKKLMRLEAAAPPPAPPPPPTAQSAAPPWAWPCAPRARAPFSEQTTVEMTEVVLPPHQNHMQHTFGGIIMDWAHKAAAICATRHAGEPQSLRTLMVNRISFREGSAVSDHLVFCASVNQVFDGGAVMEVGVRVSKRDIRDGGTTKMRRRVFLFCARDGAPHPAARAAGRRVGDEPPAARRAAVRAADGAAAAARAHARHAALGPRARRRGGDALRRVGRAARAVGGARGPRLAAA